MGHDSRFRPDIQGLRAVAVGLVILAHAGFGRAAGGFIGVDVFFVVSGFLIIGLLMREAGETARVSLLDFYARRARRIVPAATLVLLVTAVASAYLLPYVRGIEVVKDTVWAAFFGANIRFALTETDYFANGEPPSPVQHYWSLSVEEQFYILIPVLLMAIAWWVRRHQKADLQRTIVVVLGTLTAVSLAWSVYTTEAHPAAAYFSTFARAWELGIGGLVAAIAIGRVPVVRRGIAEVAAVLGLALIGYATLTFDGTSPMPGVIALIPVGGAALILAAGIFFPDTAVGRLLSLPPMTWAGDRSYSLYLWHFPVLRLCQTYWEEPRLTLPHLAVALVIIVALTEATYHFVEEPFRRGIRWRPTMRAIALYPASLVLVVGTAMGSLSYIDHLLDGNERVPAIAVSDYAGDGDFSKDPAVALVQSSVLAARDGRPVPGGLRPGLVGLREAVAPLGECDYRTGTRRLCPFGDAEADRSIVVMGDSHARAWGPALSSIGEAQGYAVYQFVFSGCPANVATRPNPDGGGEWTDCQEFKNWARGQVEQLAPDLVVVANHSYAHAFSPGEQLDGLAEELTQLDRVAGRVVMLGNTPKLPRSPGVCLSTRGVDLGDCLFRSSRSTSNSQNEFEELVKGLGLTFIDAHKWFCSDRLCPPVVGQYVTLRDREHMTPQYAEQLAEPLLRRLDLPAA